MNILKDIFITIARLILIILLIVLVIPASIYKIVYSTLYGEEKPKPPKSKKKKAKSKLSKESALEMRADSIMQYEELKGAK